MLGIRETGITVTLEEDHIIVEISYRQVQRQPSIGLS